MKTRILLVAAAVTSAVLAHAPAAHADPICVDVGVTGNVTFNPAAICVPYGDDTTCVTVTQGTPSTVVVSVKTCVPAVIGSGDQ